MNKQKPLFLSIVALLLLAGCNETSSSSASSESSTPEDSSTVEDSSTTIESSTPDESITSDESSDSTKPIEASVLYVSPEADSYSATGTIDDPMTIQRAIRHSNPGATIYLLDGTYNYGATVLIDETTEENPATSIEGRKTLKPLNPGKVLIDFSKMPWSSNNRGIKVDNDFWHIYGLEVKGAGDNGIYVGGSHIIVENCVTHDCGDTGIQLGRANSTQLTIDEWPSYNLIKNCTSYDNHDPLGEDSDGFACKLTTGVGNVFEGCIAYNNVDDGWDLYTKGDTGEIGAVTLINCIAFNNGVTSGKNTKGVPYGTPNSDGNGFKLGGEVIAVPHKVINCIAFNNLACGFTDNSNPGPLNIQNCTSYNNGLRDSDANNIDMCRDENTSVNYFKNILSYCDENVNFQTNANKHYNSKDQYKGTVVDSIFYYGRTMLQFKGTKAADYTISAMMGSILEAQNSPFVSTETPDELSDFHSLWRDENGDISLGDFLKIKDEFVLEAFNQEIDLGADLA